MIHKTFVVAGIFLLIIASCTKGRKAVPLVDAPSDTTKTVVPSDCDSTKVLFCNKIKPIITTYCATTNSCHVTGGDGTGDFSTYAGVKAKADNSSLKTRVLELHSMPPAGSTQLSSADTTLISQWLTAGAPEK